jgi:hypothetical protein
MRFLTCRVGSLFVLLLPLASAVPAPAGETGWIVLFDGKSLDAWKQPTGDWTVVAGVELDPKDPRKLVGKPGEGVIYNGSKGRTRNLVSKQAYGDIEAHVEFLIPKKANSGVKFEGVYEIQIYDSWGVEKPKATDCGGIYPRAEMKPKYHHIDEGIPPRVNACRPAGEWQTLDVIFQAPRFDAKGKKVRNARFVKVVLNGELIHENVELKTPTGNNWNKKEHPTGPLFLQADHGPVAFRNLRVRPYVEAEKGR